MNPQNKSKSDLVPPNEPPPAYSSNDFQNNQFIPQIPIDNRNITYQPNFLPTSIPNIVPLNPSINSSVIPVLPNANQYHPTNYGTVIVVREPAQSVLFSSDQFLCPVCNVGILEKEFTLLGFLLAIFFFPFGLICLFALRKWRCSLCGTGF